MKKYLKFLILVVLAGTFLTGCFKRDNLEGVTIYTTIYPIEYLTNSLYGNNSTVLSIYPDGINVNEYELTKKQIKEYSKAGLFVYNGLSDEKKIAKDFINTNKKLKIIDVSYGLKYENSIEELWMSPNNYLMLAGTIKNNLQEYINSKYIISEINTNYDILEEKISLMDAEMRTIASSAKDKGTETIVVDDNLFKYLNNYGFNIISLQDKETVSENNFNQIKGNFKNSTYKYILVKKGAELSEQAIVLKENYGATIIEVDTMVNLKTEERENNSNYDTIMKEYIENIRKIVLS